MNFPIFLLVSFFIVCFWMLLGSFSLAGLNSLLKPKWILAIETTLENLTLLITPLWVLFCCVLLARASIFPWISAPSSSGGFHASYLSEHFFFLRGIFYLALATYFGKVIRSRRKFNAALFLVCTLFFGSLASFDWILSLTPHFHSTIFGLLMIVNATLVTYAYALTRLHGNETTEDSLRIDFNNVHLAMIALWTYLNFVQYLTVWSGNLPEEVLYYKVRSHGTSGTLAALILGGQALIPIPLLLFRKLKKRLGFTKGLAYYTLCLQFVHLLWLVGVTR